VESLYPALQDLIETRPINRSRAGADSQHRWRSLVPVAQKYSQQDGYWFAAATKPVPGSRRPILHLSSRRNEKTSRPVAWLERAAPWRVELDRLTGIDDPPNH